MTSAHKAFPPDGLSVLSAAREVPSRIALVAGGESFTFGALADPVARAARALSAHGFEPGARVALSARNRVSTLIVMYALFEIGVPFVPIHSRLTPREAAVLLDDAEPALVLDEETIAQLVEPPTIPRASSQPLPPQGAAGDREQATFPSAPVDPRGVLAILYTSGTTGRPKGALLQRSAFVASAAASAANLGWREEDRWLLCMPLCHTGGLSIVTRCLLARRCVVLGGDGERRSPAGGEGDAKRRSPTSAEDRFDPASVLRAVARDRATLLSVVPTMLKALLAEDATGVLCGLRAVLVGGAAAPLSLLEECARRGVPALTTYGLTEACSQVTAQRPLRDGDRRASPPHPAVIARPGAGAPLPGVEVTIRDVRGALCGPGEPGRIHVRGPTLMAGYFRAPPLEGWFDTGDIGALDAAGELHIHARRTDLIVTGGENVYPAEIEQVLESCEGVSGALVFGVPDETWGQIVAAAIVLDRTKSTSPTALLAAVTAKLAPHKRPRRVCFPESLPRVTAEKIDRREGVRRFTPDLVAWEKLDHRR